jgi:hypothetical protein
MITAVEELQRRAVSLSRDKDSLGIVQESGKLLREPAEKFLLLFSQCGGALK